MAKYDNFSKEELTALVERQDSELASKKYGLVWDAEREPEQVVLDCENNLPVLKRVKGKEIREPKNNDNEDNILIEGDNYHALTVLNYTHQEKIDVIYIDPPYNTGNKDFKYNDKYVNKEDGFKHSKWLNFMEKRFNLAKELLKDSGAIFISIDENEVAQLKLLCDKIFGESNFESIISWRRRTNQPNDKAKMIAKVSEFVLVYAKNSINLKENKFFNTLSLSEKRIQAYSNSDNDPRGPWSTTPWCASRGQGGTRYEIITPTKIKYSETWLGMKETFDKLLKDKRIIFPNNGNGKPRKKVFLIERQEEGQSAINFWFGSVYGDNLLASAELENIFGGDRVFDNPKPVNLIKTILELKTDKNDLIVDFFAGSGTTGHAVLELNKEDGGNRKFILCTNNELNGFEKELKEKGLSEKEIQKHGICQQVTYPRLEKVIKGYKKNGDGEKVEGLGGNLQYFRTDFVRKTKNRAQVRISLTGKCTEMLCVKENIFNLEIENDNYKIFSSNGKDIFLCVYYNFAEDRLNEFIGKIKKLKGRKIIYMFSVDNEVDKSVFFGVDDFTVEAIPEGILKEYEKLNKMNIPVNKDLIYFDFNKAKKVIFEEDRKDDGAMLLRIVLEKTIQKIAQKSGVGILKSDGKGEKISLLNDKMKGDGIFSKVEWEENKTYLAIGNYAAHGEYGEYDIEQVKNFHRHIQSFLNKFGI